MVYQGTVFGPGLWNVFIVDLAIAFQRLGFEVVLSADDVNLFKVFGNSISDVLIFICLHEVQDETHSRGEGNVKESKCILLLANPVGANFKLLGLEFDTKVTTADLARKCVKEVAWGQRTLLRTQRFIFGGRIP